MINGCITEDTAGEKFLIFIVTEGVIVITCDGGAVAAKLGDSILIPAGVGEFTVSGSASFIKTYVPVLERDVYGPLMRSGFTHEEIDNTIVF